MASHKMWSLVRGTFVWDICAFVPSKAGLTKEVVFHKGGLSKGVLLYSSFCPCVYLTYIFSCNKRFEFKKTRGPPTALETQIAWKSSLLTKIILRSTLLVEKTLR